MEVSKRTQVAKISNGNIMVKSRLKFPNRRGVLVFKGGDGLISVISDFVKVGRFNYYFDQPSPVQS